MCAHCEIRAVMGRYCWHVDHDEWDEWLALFADDVSWGARGARPFEGRTSMEKVARGLAKRRVGAAPTRHVLTVAIIEVDGDQATASGYVVVVNLVTKEIATVGDVSIALAKLANRWRICRYEFDPVIDTTPASQAVDSSVT